MRVIRKFKDFLLKVYWLAIAPILLSPTIYATDLGLTFDGNGKPQYSGSPPLTIYDPNPGMATVEGVLKDSIDICINVIIGILGIMVLWESYKLTWDGDKPRERAMHIDKIKRIFVALAIAGGIKTLVSIAKALLVI